MINVYFNQFITLRDQLNLSLEKEGLAQFKPREAETISWINKFVSITTIYSINNPKVLDDGSMYLVIKRLFALFILSADDIVDEYPVQRAGLIIDLLNCKIQDPDQFLSLVSDTEDVYQYETFDGINQVEIEYLRYLFDLIRMIVYVYEENLVRSSRIDDPSLLNKINSQFIHCFREYQWTIANRAKQTMITSSQRLTYHHTQGAGFALHIDGLMLGSDLHLELPDLINKTFLILNSIAGFKQEVIRGDRTNYLFCLYHDLIQFDMKDFDNLDWRQEIVTKIQAATGLKKILSSKLYGYLESIKAIFVAKGLDYERFEKAIWRVYPVKDFLIGE